MRLLAATWRSCALNEDRDQTRSRRPTRTGRALRRQDGAASLHFVHVMPTSNAVEDESSLSLAEQRAAEEEIAILARIFKMDIGIDVGYYNIDESRPRVRRSPG